jgi:hypothetical protein
VKRLAPILFPIAYPGPDYAEGLYMGRDGDIFIVWAETPEGGGWCAQAAYQIEPLLHENMSEQLRRQYFRMSGVDDVV